MVYEVILQSPKPSYQVEKASHEVAHPSWHWSPATLQGFGSANRVSLVLQMKLSSWIVATLQINLYPKPLGFWLCGCPNNNRMVSL